MPKSLFLISNASSEYYPENKLTNFKNKLPQPIEFDKSEKWEMAIASIGFSTKFRNITLPDDSLPNFIISNCDDQNKQLDTLDFKYENNEDYKLCTWWFYTFEDQYYTTANIKSFFQSVNRKSNTSITFNNNILSFEKKVGNENYWVLLHPSMLDTFNIQRKLFNFMTSEKDKRLHKGEIRLANSEIIEERTVLYKNQVYYAYYISTSFLTGGIVDIQTPKYPSVVKVVSENISAQIFNNTYSKDLQVFCPDFKNDETENFITLEFTTKQYAPILNNILSDLKIELLDENNKSLSLLPGPATIIKMDFKQMPLNKKSVNVRLTSTPTKTFADNTSAKFRVLLPSVMNINRDWEVTLASISHPNIFSTFIDDDKTKTFYVRNPAVGSQEQFIFTFPTKAVFSENELVQILDEQLKKHNLGSAILTPGYEKVMILFNKPIIFGMSNDLLRMLGFTDELSQQQMTVFKISDDNVMGNYVTQKSANGEFIMKFKEKINLNYFRPHYIIVYASIVSSSILGGVYSKVLRVIPIESSKTSYVISDLKHKEFYELQNTEITDIEIELRAHDGIPINFAGDQDVIVNLEFSNYFD